MSMHIIPRHAPYYDAIEILAIAVGVLLVVTFAAAVF
jgi:hypothetical protein